jgi:isocitrate lyase
MKAYVEIIQRKERELGTDVLTHQKVRFQFRSCFKTHSVTHSGAAQTMPTTSSRLLLAESRPPQQWALVLPSRSL